MSRPDCAWFEATLAEALASARPCRPEDAARLSAHVASCATCRGSADLVDLATLPPASRDPYPDPPAGYWARFESGLAERIDRERRSRAVRRAVGAAAAVVVLAIGLAVVLRERPFGSETTRALPPVDLPAVGTDDALEPFPPAGVLGGFSEEGGASIFSGAEDMTPDDEERLLEWLKSERERAAGGAA